MASTVYSGAWRCCAPPPTDKNWPRSELLTAEEEHLAAKISRAMQSGPHQITKDATVAEYHRDGTITMLREGTNEWICFPGNENEVGNVPMCCNPQGLQWAKDALSGKPAPTNTAPGLIYMLCGASQHSTTDVTDKTSPGIPIGPHWMITWLYDAKRDGLPTTVRDAGAWVMFDGTPYAHLHICGTPWAGKEYDPNTTSARWTMEYVTRP
jgi:hypothetical protein